ncbi:hypothetical protein BDF20DRAFT_836912 [Mycotypha africana]|uniref:uncharacterized protein n=1 Tax=Mycotypha africana TaxID=64632 RepID=UPI002301A93D|nr:uncharacterized protein BDF20DRAFT_836912 [Mycotypha africana]KAI8975521.1 hypothetical protein BDF20DRAFT_836912 [Mycotypha africana]
MLILNYLMVMSVLLEPQADCTIIFLQVEKRTLAIWMQCGLNTDILDKTFDAGQMDIRTTLTWNIISVPLRTTYILTLAVNSPPIRITGIMIDGQKVVEQETKVKIGYYEK